MEIMVEIIIMAFVVGGVVGTALQFSNVANKVPVKIERDSSNHRRRMR